MATWAPPAVERVRIVAVRPRWLCELLWRDVLLLLLLLSEKRSLLQRRGQLTDDPAELLLLLLRKGRLNAERVQQRELQLLLPELIGGDCVRRGRPHADDGLTEAVESGRARTGEKRTGS